MSFERRATAGRGDMDFNAHMRNTTYLDMSATLRAALDVLPRTSDCQTLPTSLK
jgi:hypothetical protein